MIVRSFVIPLAQLKHDLNASNATTAITSSI
jgi:hypothetical protein